MKHKTPVLLIPLLCFVWAGTASGGPITFGPASPVAELNSIFSERMTHLSTDGLRVTIHSNRSGPGAFNLFRATRPDLSSPFSTPAEAEFATVNGTAFNIANGVLSVDELELFYHFASSPAARPFFRTTRASTAVNFPGGSEVSTITTPAGDFRRPTFLSADSLRLYYNAGQSVGGAQDIFLAKRPDLATAFTLSAFDPFININTSSGEADLSMTPDELEIYFASDRPGGLGGADIWYASRASTAVAFDAPINVTTLNTAADEYSPRIFQSTMFFNRGADIFSASATTVIPEPSSLMLLFSGAIGLIGYGARRKRKQAA